MFCFINLLCSCLLICSLLIHLICFAPYSFFNSYYSFLGQNQLPIILVKSSLLLNCNLNAVKIGGTIYDGGGPSVLTQTVPLGPLSRLYTHGPPDRLCTHRLSGRTTFGGDRILHDSTTRPLKAPSRLTRVPIL